MNATINQQAAQPAWSSRNLNSLALLGVCLALGIAFYYQLAFGELPCPLCLLQRAGLILIGIGLALNVRFGVRGLHYGAVLVAAVATGAIAVRQVLLHIVPGTGAYGSSLLGLHFYTWAAIASIVVVVFVALMLLLPGDERSGSPSNDINTMGKIAIALFLVMIAANLASTLLECGFGQCADDPVVYQWLSHT
jgi:disulfide bond formation protein DsbB